MPAGIMIPARPVPSMIGSKAVGPGPGPGGYGSSSALGLGQPNLLEGQLPLQHQLVEMTQTTAESEMARGRGGGGGGEEDFESKSGSENIEGASGDDQDPNQRSRKKRYHRHTQHQIQEMEAFFKECPHPDDKQRKELSRELGLEPLQIKFWFQNKRTQMKSQHERHENTQLRAENDKLHGENLRYKEALSRASCPSCDGHATLGEMSFDEHHLRMENARLREEIDRISAIAAKYVGKPMDSYPLLSSPMAGSRSPLDLGFGVQAPEMFGVMSAAAVQGEVDKPMVIELAVAAMEELIRMAQLGEPLWTAAGPAGVAESLNEEEYVRNFPRGIGPRPFGLKAEASRETAVVIMDHVDLVEMLMDVNQWSTVFSGIVSRAVTLEVLSTGVAGNCNGALQVMSAEFQVPSPLVPTRESLFVRYCKQHGDGTWAVVDVSLDGLRPSPVLRCRRRPSGCLIQDMSNGCSKVTWVEHVEVDDRAVHNIYKPLVNSGLAFGAKRWVSTLDRQCERLASVMASDIPAGDGGGNNFSPFPSTMVFFRQRKQQVLEFDLVSRRCWHAVIQTSEGRKSMLKLAERMAMSFCGGVSASTTHQWTTLSGSGAEDVRVMTRKSVDDPGRPPGIVLNAATSFWLPVQPQRVFDFLRDESSRSKWDILSHGGVVQEMAHIANGRDHGNCVSLLHVNSPNQSNMLILQESCTDSTGSYVIYAPVDVAAMNVVLNGGDPDHVALLPSGFAILPDGPTSIVPDGGGTVGEVGTGGSLLTVAFQILVDSIPTAKLSLGSVATVNNLIARTVERIKAPLSGEAVQ